MKGVKGYAYLHPNGELNYKTKEYIDNENPGFWMDNSPFILRAWIFDTEDLPSMSRMYKSFSSLKLKSNAVLQFSAAISFDINKLKNNENSL